MAASPFGPDDDRRDAPVTDTQAAQRPDNRLRGVLQTRFDRVPPGWRDTTGKHAESPDGRRLIDFVDSRVVAGAVIYPDAVFRALEFGPPESMRVVILGQDPYHGAGQAQGLAFSVAPGLARRPPSLRNLLAEVEADTGLPPRCRDDLSAWAAQGVLLLNSVLTVEDGRPNSHAGHGWEALTDALLARVAAQPRPAVFMLWGASAQRKRVLIEAASGTTAHLLLTANHPSPLSARRPPMPFIGCGHFGLAQAHLARHRPGEPPVRW